MSCFLSQKESRALMTFAIDSAKRSVLMSSTKGSFSVHEVSGLMTGKKECAPFQINKTVNAKPKKTSLKRASKRKDWASLVEAVCRCCQTKNTS